MTREEQIREASIAYTKANCPRAIGGDYFRDRVNPFNINHDFIEGAEWADANQPNPWISVEDKLPDRLPAKFANWSKEVIVAVKRGRECRIYVDRYSHIYKTWGVFEDGVTHWMPIPELPKED